MSLQKTFWTQATFRILLDCQARPGKLGQLESGSRWPLVRGRYLEPVLATLLDHLVTCHVSGLDERERQVVEQYLALDLDAGLAAVEVADFLLYLATPPLTELARAKTGSLEFPEEGATVMVAVVELGPGEGEAASGAAVLSLSGPGVKGEKELRVQGLGIDFWSRLGEINRGFPQGLDIVLVDEAGRVACIPRSTQITSVRDIGG